MSLQKMSPEWNDAVRDLYRSSNEMMGVSTIFTDRVLCSDLADPFWYYSQKGAKLLLWVDPTSKILLGMVGIVGNGGCVGEIQRLTVHPDYRRKGIARHLMKIAHQTAIDILGYDEYIFSCLKSNDVALAFYRSLTFVQEMYHVNYYGNGHRLSYKQSAYDASLDVKYTLVYFESLQD